MFVKRVDKDIYLVNSLRRGCFTAKTVECREIDLVLYRVFLRWVGTLGSEVDPGSKVMVQPENLGSTKMSVLRISQKFTRFEQFVVLLNSLDRNPRVAGRHFGQILC